MRLFLCGDVMTGRGIDQVLPHSCDPRLYEPVVTSASQYVALAERANGPIPHPVEHRYVWGEALEILDALQPDLRIINLETSVTTSDEAFPKGINYRMHPGNVPLLQEAGIDCCVLANNHVLDWGVEGLLETLDALEGAAIATVGAGRDPAAARAPVRLPAGPGSSLLLFAVGAQDAGVTRRWMALPDRPGVNVLASYSHAEASRIASLIAEARLPGDVVAVSVHWGRNWGYEIPDEHLRFAHALIDEAGVDLIFGHSSHHPKAVEAYQHRLILYGCGDFLNDYEGISGHEAFRGDLVLMYLPEIDDATGVLTRLDMVPLKVRNFRLTRPTPAERTWLAETLDRECARFGHRVNVREAIFTLDEGVKDRGSDG